MKRQILLANGSVIHLVGDEKHEGSKEEGIRGMKILKQQSIKIMTTLSTNPTKKIIADCLSVMIQKLLDEGWSLNINISEDGGCWEVSGDNPISSVEHLDLDY